MKLWLENLVKITKKMIHQVTGLTMLNKSKETKNLTLAKLLEKIGVEWDERVMKLTRVTNIEIKFAIQVISHKM